MDFAAFLALVTSFLSLSFELSPTVSVTIGQLVIFTIILWISRAFALSLIRG